MTDISIIIVSWNTRELLKECIESVYRCTAGVSFDLFVVDNASTDGSAAMVRETFPQVKLIENAENAGFSKANNQAIRRSHARYIGLLNSDTVLITDVFAPLVAYADLHEETGAVGPKVLCRDGRTVQNVCARNLPNLYYDFCRLSGLSRKFSGTRLFGGEYLSYWDHQTSRHVEGLVGACMVVRKRAIDDIGLMDENQFMYGDEIDWCRRLLDGGWNIYYEADAAIIHYGGESSKQVKAFAGVEAEKALKYYYRKHNGHWYAVLFSLEVGVVTLGKYVWSILFKSKSPRVRELRDIYKRIFTWSFSELLRPQK
ncbi:MAG: glycosyltransferase family 2 protein [Nitrospirae bacterium]|nr:glycosyltransferase family 2 protein [Nitrospirota bacterium]